MLNALSVDVEEYFHPTEVQASADPSQWSTLPPRIDNQIDRILELFESRKTKATFFILGWIAEHHPCVVRAIAAAGHEIGCHSHMHRLVYSLSPQEFRRDTRRAIQAIQDACGVVP